MTVKIETGYTLPLGKHCRVMHDGVALPYTVDASGTTAVDSAIYSRDNVINGLTVDRYKPNANDWTLTLDVDIFQQAVVEQILFENSEPGIWFDPNDLSTMFQDTAGTTPVTEPGQTVARINDKSGNGNHATQATATARPTYGIVPETGRRNLLTYSEQFDNAAWEKSGTATVVGNLFRCGATAASELRQNNLSLASGNATFSLEAEAENSNFVVIQVFDVETTSLQRTWFNLATGVVASSAGSGANVSFVDASIEALGGGRYRCKLSVNLVGATTTARTSILISDADAVFNGNASSGVFLWGAQLEQGTEATPYQRVTTQFDVTEQGVKSLGYLFFDGVDDFLMTPTITPGTDKVQVFAGVRKLSDITGIMVELSASVPTNNGSFNLLAPSGGGSNSYRFGSKGTSEVFAGTGSFAVAPDNAVITALGNISGDTATLRRNAVEIEQNTADQGTGNYLAYPLYIGARGGTSLFFNGHIHQLIARFGPNLPTSDIELTEKYVASKTASGLIADDRAVSCLCAGIINSFDANQTITLEKFTSEWEAVAETTPQDNSPLMFLFEESTAERWRLKGAGFDKPVIYNVMIGNALVMERPFYGDFIPSRMNRNTKIQSNQSRSGELLGRSRIKTVLNVKYPWNNLTDTWVRTNLDGPSGLIQSLETKQAYLAWRPLDRQDVDYLIESNNSAPSPIGRRNLYNYTLSGSAYSYE